MGILKFVLFILLLGFTITSILGIMKWVFIACLDWIKKPYYWTVFMGLLAVILVLLSTINKTMFNLMSFSLITVPLIGISGKFININENTIYRKAYKAGLVSYIICGVLFYLFFYTEIIKINQ